MRSVPKTDRSWYDSVVDHDIKGRARPGIDVYPKLDSRVSPTLEIKWW